MDPPRKNCHIQRFNVDQQTSPTSNPTSFDQGALARTPNEGLPLALDPHFVSSLEAKQGRGIGGAKHGETAWWLSPATPVKNDLVSWDNYPHYMEIIWKVYGKYMEII